MKQYSARYYHATSNKKYTFLFPNDSEIGDIYYDRSRDSYVEIFGPDTRTFLFQLRELDEKVASREERQSLNVDTKNDFYWLRKRKERKNV